MADIECVNSYLFVSGGPDIVGTSNQEHVTTDEAQVSIEG
jgi:hypothetical protein